jgi:hypothetical protein
LNPNVLPGIGAFAMSVLMINVVLFLQNAHLPKSRSLREFLWREMYKYESDIDRDLIDRNHLIKLTVGMPTFFILLAVFGA